MAQIAQVSFPIFGDYVKNVIRAIAHDANPNEPFITNAVSEVAVHLNHDFARLEHVIEVFLARVTEDTAWASTVAVRVYELLDRSISPEFPHPDDDFRTIKGGWVLQHQMLGAIYAQSQQMVEKSEWSPGLIAFLGKLCRAGGRTSPPQNMVFKIITSMVSSVALMLNDNLDILLGFLMAAGPLLDCQTKYLHHVTAVLQHLTEIAKFFKTSDRLAIYGLSQVRIQGWQVQEVEGMPPGGHLENQVPTLTIE